MKMAANRRTVLAGLAALPVTAFRPIAARAEPPAAPASATTAGCLPPPPETDRKLPFSCKYVMTKGPRTQTARAFADYIDSFQSPWVGAFFDLGNHARYGDVAGWVRELGPRIVKLDIKGYSNARADKDGPWKGFVDITAGDIDWASVRAALREIGFTGWVSAEVGGGDVARLKIVLDQMQQALLG